MTHSVAKFDSTAGPEAAVLERVDWFGRYRRMRLVERTDHSIVVCGGSRWLWGQVFLRVTTEAGGSAVHVTLEAWARDWIGGEWNVDPSRFSGALPRGMAWDYAVSLAAYLGAQQPEKLFAHGTW